MHSHPHVCPICKGRERVAAGFYPDDPERTICKACSGTGVVWGWDYTWTWSAPYVQIPYINPVPINPVWQGQGYRCSGCGAWIFPGLGSHWCSSVTYVPYPPVTSTATWSVGNTTITPNTFSATLSFPPDEPDAGVFAKLGNPPPS